MSDNHANHAAPAVTPAVPTSAVPQPTTSQAYPVPMNFPGPFGHYPQSFPGQYPPQQYQLQQQPQQTADLTAEQLKTFWQGQMLEVQQVGADTHEFKNHQLPLARIKKIMKSDEDVRMISAEAPVLFAKACEMFILELTLRAWLHAEENKRRTLQRNDIAAAIARTEIFDFLIDIIPNEDCKPEQDGSRPIVPSQQSIGQPSFVPGAGMYYPFPMPPPSGENPMMPMPQMPSMDAAMMYQQQAFMSMQGQHWPAGMQPAASQAMNQNPPFPNPGSPSQNPAQQQQQQQSLAQQPAADANSKQ